MRSIWTGSISFGLINIPVKLFSAVQESSLYLDMLDSKDHSNIKFLRVNESTGKEILKPYKNVIVLNRIRLSQEIREPSELKLPPVSKAKTKEMDMANKLVDQLTEKFNISKYKDTYTSKLLKIIKEKSRGKKISVPKLKVVHRQSDNLMDMLQASLAGKKSKSA